MSFYRAPNGGLWQTWVTWSDDSIYVTAIETSTGALSWRRYARRP